MRASEIRNLLIQKYGFSAEAIARVLDKSELKRLLLAEMVKVQDRDKNESLKSSLYYVLYILAGVFLFALALRPMISYVKELRSNKDKGMNKMKLVLRHYRKGYIMGSVTLFLSVILDGISTGMTLSTFASWIIPHDSPFRSLLLPMFSCPLNASMIASIASGKTAAASTQGGGYGLDIGPMLTIGLVNWLIHQLQELSSSFVLKGMLRKEERKAKKSKKDSEQHSHNTTNTTRKQVREKTVDVASAFAKSMRASRDHGLTDDPQEDEYDIDTQCRSLSGPPMPSMSTAGGDNYVDTDSRALHSPPPDLLDEEVNNTLATDFDEVRRLNQHFARVHSREVNNDTVHYTKEDQIDICILERLSSICEETPEDVALESSSTSAATAAVVDDDGDNSPHNPVEISPRNISPVYSPMSMTREHSEAMMANLQNVDYYNQEDSPSLHNEVSPGKGDLLSPSSTGRHSTISEDSDDEMYKEAATVSGDTYDSNNIDE